MDNLFFNRKGRPKYADDVIPAYKNGYFALLVKENKILLTYPPGVGVPEFPGGSIRRSENFRDCLFRKLYEETGVEFMLDKGVRQFEQTVNYFADDKKPSGMFYIYHQFFMVYEADAYGFDVLRPRWKTPENGEAVWADIEDIFSGKVKINYCHWLALQQLFPEEFNS